jgi:FkbM family methyltransferase
MPPDGALRRVLDKLIAGSPIVYVDCGARGGRLPPWLRPLRHAAYIGFEADPAECARLNERGRARHRYIAAFLGRGVEQRTFFVTRSAACSSLLEPNMALLNAFAGLGPLFEVEHTISVETIPLERCLQDAGISSVDFIELDTQGAELQILAGGGHTVLDHVVGIRVEVEFAPMYAGQPLFADVDGWLRARGFQLFDLERYRARRAAVHVDVPTSGQLLWGQALYLRTHEGLSPERAVRLGVIAALLNRPDLAVEVLRGIPPGALDKHTDRLIRLAIQLLSVTPKSTWLSAWRHVTGALRPGADPDAGLARSCGHTTWRD